MWFKIFLQLSIILCHNIVDGGAAATLSHPLQQWARASVAPGMWPYFPGTCFCAKLTKVHKHVCDCEEGANGEEVFDVEEESSEKSPSTLLQVFTVFLN